MAPAISPNPIIHVSQSGILLSLSIFPRAKTTTNTIAAAANKHTIKNAVSIPALYHIRDEKNALIQARNIDWTTLEKREVTVTLDSTGNHSLNIPISDYLIISCYQKPSSNMKNGNFTCYSWNDGKYQVHGDMNYGGEYVTGSVTLILTLLKIN